MVTISQTRKASAGWSTARLLSVMNQPMGSGRTSEALMDFISSENCVEVARDLDEGNAGKLVDGLDQLVDLEKPRNVASRRAFCTICSVTARLPRAMVLSDGVKKRGDIAVASGGFTDVWRGLYNSKDVALKAFRTYPIQDLKDAKKILWKEVVVWKRLSHNNILPFHGVDMTNFQLALVYDWSDSGNIVQYLDLHPEVSRARLLHGVAQGLQYLHSSGVVHGDLKGSNVLISPSGQACLSDYGLMRIQSNHAFMIAATPGVVGISRWLAPELINPPRKKGGRQPAGTEQADIFAFAMLVIEVFTGRLPFGDVRHETAILMIARGQRPEKPQGAEGCGFTPEIWKSIRKCWHQHPAKRPSVGDVVVSWRGFVSQERIRGFPQVVHSNNQEKHQPQPHKPFAKYFDRPTKSRFCGLF